MINSYEEFVDIYKDDLDDAINHTRDLDELVNEIADSETQVYTSDLLKWYLENIHRLQYIDDYLEQFGCHGQTIFNLLQGGQYVYLRKTCREYANKYIEEKSNQIKGE